MKVLTLDSLTLRQKAIVKEISKESTDTLRLIELGFTPGSEIKALRRSPFGDPTAYIIKGTIIALRRHDAKKIIISTIRECD